MITAASQQENANSCGTVAAVAFPVAIPGVYDYEIPHRFAGRVALGLPVLVEVKRSRVWGVVIEIKKESAFKEKLKEIIDIKEGHWADSNRSLLKLYGWIARYYQCPVGRVFRPVAGKSVVGKGAKAVTVYRCVRGGADGGIDDGANSGANGCINDSINGGISGDANRIAAL
ncbi:MAG: hypothetical protein LBH93_06615, partial [Chitinispirillales bacterium]|nr:hypothetical protein [Chitinispirillales bacterium]